MRAIARIADRQYGNGCIWSVDKGHVQTVTVTFPTLAEKLEVSGPGGYVPGVSVSPSGLALWLGAGLAVIGPGGGGARWESPEDVLSVLPMDNGWLVVRELGVEIRSGDLLDQRAVYDLDEVIVDWVIDAERLRIVDFNGHETLLTLALEVASQEPR